MQQELKMDSLWKIRDAELSRLPAWLVTCLGMDNDIIH